MEKEECVEWTDLVVVGSGEGKMVHRWWVGVNKAMG